MGLWKYIRRGLGIFSLYTHLVVGDGSKMRLWQDLCCGDRVLKEAFHEVLGIVRVQDASIADLL